MRAVLYICHGSRVKAGQLAALNFIEQTKEHVGVPIQEACFLELAEPTIEQGIKRCMEQGATKIVAIPFLLLTAGHAKIDIPEQLQKTMTHYPEVTLQYGDTLGVHPDLIDVLKKRMATINMKEEQPAVLLVGRGSSDPVIHDYFTEILKIFKSKTAIENVRVCYLAASYPRFEDALLDLIKEQPREIVVIPYLLFTGVLMNDINMYIQQRTSDIPIYLSPSLGYDELISQIVAERVKEASIKGVILHGNAPDYSESK